MIISFYFRSLYGIIQYEKVEENEISMGICVSEVVVKFYPKRHLITIINTMKRPNYGLIRDILKSAEYTIVLEKYPEIKYIEEHSETLSLHRIKYIVILLRKGYMLYGILSGLNQYKYDFDGNFLIVVTYKNSDMLDTVRELVDICWHFKIINVNFSIRNNDTIKMFSYNPFLNKQVYITGECNSSQINLNDNMFSSKTKNFHKHPILIASLNYTFFMSLEPVQTQEHYLMSGMEGDIFNVICSKLNLTCVVAYTQPNETRNIRWQNGTYTWGLGSLYRRETDCSVGYNELLKLATDSFEFSRPHYIATLAWVVSKPDLISSWARLYASNNSEVWMTLLTLIFIGCTVIILLNYSSKFYRNLFLGERNSHPFFNLYAALLGYSIPIYPSFISRYFALVWILSTFVFRASYQAASIKFLTGDTKESIPKSESEMVARGYKYIIHKNYKEVFLAKNLLLKPIYAERNTDIFKTLLDANGKRKYVSHRFKDIIQFYNQKHYKEGILETTMENIEYSSLVMYFAPGSIFRKEIDRQIEYIRESGIILKLKNRYIRPYIWSRKGSAPARALKKKELILAFEILLYGNISSFVIFLMELLHKRFFYKKILFKKLSILRHKKDTSLITN